MKHLLWIPLFLVVAYGHAQTHPWDGIIAPGRATDWTHAGIPGGVPNVTTICATPPAGVTFPIQPSGDTTSVTDTNNINNALAACGTLISATAPMTPPPIQVVPLAAGVFYGNGIRFGNTTGNQQRSYVVLRGAGPDQTTVVTSGSGWAGTTGCGQFGYVCMQGPSYYPGSGGIAGNTLWTGGYAKGSTVLTLVSTAGLVTAPIGASGNIILLDQRNDAIGVCPSTIVGGNAGLGCAPGGTPVDGASQSGTTVTIHTSLAHNFTQNQCVGLSMVGQTWHITGATWTAGSPPTVTITIDVSSLPHNLFAGANNPIVQWGNNNLIALSGVTPSGYNTSGNGALITAVTPTQVTFTCPSGQGCNTNPGTFVPSATAAAVNYRGYNGDTDLTNSCGGKAGWVTVATVPDPYTFTYASGNSGLTNGGAGQVTADTGGVYIGALPGITSNEGGGNGRKCPSTFAGTVSCATGEISNRSLVEVKRVMDICGSGGTWQVAGGACTPSTIRIDPPIEMPNWRSSQNPAVYWLGAYVVEDGIENLTLDMSYGNYSSSNGGIILTGTYQSWVKNLRTVQGNRNHIWTQYGLQNTIEDNYFFGVKGTGNQSYGIEDWSSDGLNQNNICQHIIACEMIGWDFGTVWGYNYAVDAPFGGSPLGMMNSANLNHDFAGMQLEEGENMTGALTDNIHGTSCCTTIFRTRLRAQDTPWKSGQLIANNHSAYNRANNTIDSVLGTRASELNFYDKRLATDGPSIYNTGAQAENFSVATDMLLRDFVLRWGNYDVCTDAGNTSVVTETPCVAAGATNGIRFCGNASSTGFGTTCNSTSEIPTAGAPSFWIAPNPVPTVGDTGAGQAAFPASFYLPGQPLWWQTAWGTPGWPAIGSDVIASGPLDTTPATPLPVGTSSTIYDGVQHHSYQIPAQICWNNSPIDPLGSGPNGSPQVAYPINGPITTTSLSGQTQYSIPLPAGHIIPICGSSNCMPVYTLTGVNPPDYNGTYMAYIVTATSISFVRTSSLPALPAYVSGGTVNWPNVRLYNAAACYPVAYGTTPPQPGPAPSIINGNGKITGQGKIT